MIGGFPVVVSTQLRPWVSEQYRFPRSRKRRIRRKWRRKLENYRLVQAPGPEAVLIGSTLYVTPEHYARLVRTMAWAP